MSALSGSRLRRIETLGQSLWLDHIDRAMLLDGRLEELIRDDGISGVSLNPAICEKAIAGHDSYDTAIAALARRGLEAREMYEELAVADATLAADMLRDTYEASCSRVCCGCDGFVSLEVAPYFAHDTEATVATARRLWERVQRPNLMIKVPATRAGLAAIRQLIAAGINVNATLLFGVARYREVAESYVAGLEERLAQGGELDHVASVAGFFLSRIDTLVDGLLDRDERPLAQVLRGQAAIACARLAYREYQDVLRSARWQAVAAHGARPQRLLWASTSTKDAAYDDVKYVEALIGPDTVTILPPETVVAYRDHGKPALRLDQDLDAACALPGQLAVVGVDLASLNEELERQGMQKLIEPYERLLATLARRARELAT